jgi:Holliday junction resolvase RusA-like endonuclease
MMQTLFDTLPLMPPPPAAEAKKRASNLYAVIILAGEPEPKGRPRARIAGGYGKQFVHFYQPPETAAYEKRIKDRAQDAVKGLKPIEGKPIGLLIRVYLPIPTSWSKKKQCAALRGEVVPMVKPDWDNFRKIASDALNEIVYRDDALVTDARVIKRYSDQPRMEIEVYL